MSGLDWREAPQLSGFASAGRLREAEFQSLAARGYFSARASILHRTPVTMLIPPSGASSVSAMLLALGGDSPIVSAIPLGSSWPVGRFLVLKASGGADVMAAARRTTGSVLVVEYPPKSISALRRVDPGSTRRPTAPGPNWSRMWLLGKSWPEGLPVEPSLGVPGLVSASALARLVLRPAEFAWRPGVGGANRWFLFVQSLRPVTGLVLFAALAALVFAGATRAAQERKSVLLCGIARVLTLAPAALVLGGNLAHAGGLTGGVVWMGIALLALTGISEALDFAASRASAREPLFGYALTGCVALMAADPRYSLLGSVFDRGPVVEPGEALGAALGAFCVLATSLGARGRSGFALAWLIAAACDVTAAFMHPWWSNGSIPFGDWWLVAAAAASSMGVVAWVLSPIASSLRIAAAVTIGVVFLPPGLVDDARQVTALNLAEIPRFLLSPAVIGSLFLAGALALYSSRFLAHQIRNVWRERPPARPLGLLFLVCLAGGLFNPSLLRAGLMCGFGLVLVIVEDLMRPRELVE